MWKVNQSHRKHRYWNRFEVYGPSVVTLLNWTPIFEQYMARLIVKNGHQKDTCYNEIALCAQNLDAVLGSIFNTIWRDYVITKRKWVSFWPLTTFASQFFFWTLCDPQLRTGWDNYLFDPKVNIACGVGCAHNRATNLNWMGRKLKMKDVSYTVHAEMQPINSVERI